MPTFYCTILGGPNGSGKSSSFEALRPEGEFVNADEIAKALPVGIDDNARNFQAGRLAVQRINTLIASKASFVFETTLSSKHAIRVMQQAKDAGFEVGLFYVTLDSPQRNIERVAFRVADGGHNIPQNDIVRRYEASLANLVEALRVADKVVIMDNSNSRPIVVFEIKKGVVQKYDIRDGNPLHDRLKATVCEAYGLVLYDDGFRRRPKTQEARVDNYNMVVRQKLERMTKMRKSNEEEENSDIPSPPGFKR